MCPLLSGLLYVSVKFCSCVLQHVLELDIFFYLSSYIPMYTLFQVKVTMVMTIAVNLKTIQPLLIFQVTQIYI